jgi:hypothetical protein
MGEESITPESELRRRIVAETPGWYSPTAHFLFPAVLGVGLIVACGWWVRHPTVPQLMTIPIVFVCSNAFEWRAHKYALHRRTRLAPVLYDRHTPIHHRLFVEEDMAVRDRREYRLVLMPAFGVVAIFVLTAPVMALLWLLLSVNTAALFMATSIGYVLLYEWLHLSYHLPTSSLVGRSRIIARLRRHHARHHDPRLMQRWNMNVSIPLWDWVRGTIHRDQPSPDKSASAPETSSP